MFDGRLARLDHDGGDLPTKLELAALIVLLAGSFALASALPGLALPGAALVAVCLAVATIVSLAAYAILGRRVRVLEQAVSVAEHASAAKSHFLANMSHELRTPLSAIIGYAEMLEEDAAGESLAGQDLQRIQSAAKHLLALIDQVLDLSKIEAGKMELVLEPVEVRAIVDDVSRTVEPLVRKNGNTFEIRCREDIGYMLADPMRLRQILFNLLSNASKFTEDGTVALEVERVDGAMVFKVTDTGIGMTPQQTSTIFEAFQQADATTSRHYGGTGLGLVICREFCQLAGGDIDVASAFGRGTAFTVRLPLGGATAPVLVIDDEASARRLLADRLAEDQLHVVTASSGEEGLRLARSLKPRAITLDAMLPDVGGESVLQSLRADRELGLIPVFVIAVQDGEEMESFSLELLVDEIGSVVRKAS